MRTKSHPDIGKHITYIIEKMNNILKMDRYYIFDFQNDL